MSSMTPEERTALAKSAASVSASVRRMKAAMKAAGMPWPPALEAVIKSEERYEKMERAKAAKSKSAARRKRTK